MTKLQFLGPKMEEFTIFMGVPCGKAITITQNVISL